MLNNLELAKKRALECELEERRVPKPWIPAISTKALTLPVLKMYHELPPEVDYAC